MELYRIVKNLIFKKRNGNKFENLIMQIHEQDEDYIQMGLFMHSDKIVKETYKSETQQLKIVFGKFDRLSQQKDIGID